MATGLLNAPSNWQFANYNGQQVRTDSDYMKGLEASAAKVGMSAQEYDKTVNPSTYGARWGGVDPSLSKTTATQMNATGATGSGQVSSTGSGASSSSGLLNARAPSAPNVQAASGQVSSTGSGASSSSGLLNARAPSAPNVQAASAVSAPVTSYSTSNADAVRALAQGYTSAQTNVSPEATSQYQLGRMLSSNSPLMEQAATSGLQQANRRGLLNSSIAVGAAQDAMIRNAAPFAQQDANTYAQAGAATAAAENAARQFGAGAQNTAELQNAQSGTQVNLTNAAEANRAAAQNTSEANASSRQNAQLGTQVSLENARAANTAALADVDNQLKASLANLQANTQLSMADKEAASRQALAEAQNRTNLIIARGNNSTQELLNTADNAARLGLAQIDQDTKMKIANLDMTTQTNLAKLKNDHSQVLQANVSAANMFNQYMTNIANISSSTSMDATAKQQATNNQLAALQSGLSAIGEVSQLDLGKYFQSAESSLPKPEPASAAPASPYRDGGGG